MPERIPSIPGISTQQMIEEYGITLIQMMENAGRNLAEMARKMCIQAAVTLTLALPKTGLLHPKAAACVGQLYLADISIPPELYAGPGLDMQVEPLFTHQPIVKVL